MSNKGQDMTMWEGSYGKEPFDLKLTGLRLISNLVKITIVTFKHFFSFLPVRHKHGELSVEFF